MSSLVGIPLLVTLAEAHKQLLSLLDALEDTGMDRKVDSKCAPEWAGCAGSCTTRDGHRRKRYQGDW